MFATGLAEPAPLTGTPSSTIGAATDIDGCQPTVNHHLIETDTSGCAGRRHWSEATGGGLHTPRWRFLKGISKPISQASKPRNRHDRAVIGNALDGGASRYASAWLAGLLSHPIFEYGIHPRLPARPAGAQGVYQFLIEADGHLFFDRPFVRAAKLTQTFKCCSYPTTVCHRGLAPIDRIFVGGSFWCSRLGGRDLLGAKVLRSRHLFLFYRHNGRK